MDQEELNNYIFCVCVCVGGGGGVLKGMAPMKKLNINNIVLCLVMFKKNSCEVKSTILYKLYKDIN